MHFLNLAIIMLSDDEIIQWSEGESINLNGTKLLCLQIQAFYQCSCRAESCTTVCSKVPQGLSSHPFSTTVFGFGVV